MSIVDRLLKRKRETEQSEGDFNAEPLKNGDNAGDFDVSEQKTLVIGKDQIAEADAIMKKYKDAKSDFDERLRENEKWYKLKTWEVIKKGKDTSEIEPTTAWLFNCIASKHADAMDNYPQPNILPREKGDKDEANKLSSIIPVVLEQADYEQTYNDVSYRKIKSGVGVYGVFWDKDKLNGLGDISIKKISALSLLWEPGITDIQESENVFYVELVSNNALVAQYPQLNGKIGSSISAGEYLYDQDVDVSDKTPVVDWYYKRKQNGKTILHYVKYVGDEVLFASENEKEYADGWYNHGLYPFVFDVLFGIEGTPIGFGYIDIGKNSQEYIDRLNKAILENILATSRPRYMVSNSGSLNEKEFCDLSKDIVHINGQLNDEVIRAIQTPQISNYAIAVLNQKIEEMKETTGNRDVANGGTAQGVTAASGIAALQESSGKLSRDSNKSAYRAQAKVVNLVIELIRQYYDTPRQFRIVGENGQNDFVSYDNSGVLPQAEINPYIPTDEPTYRLPMFDIRIVPQKASPYTKQAQNQLAIQLLQLGVFNPQLADQSTMMLDMMDFDNVDDLKAKVASQGGLLQENMMLKQQLAQLLGISPQAVTPSGEPMPNGGQVAEPEAEGVSGEPKHIQNMRAQANEASAPR